MESRTVEESVRTVSNSGHLNSFVKKDLPIAQTGDSTTAYQKDVNATNAMLANIGYIVLVSEKRYVHLLFRVSNDFKKRRPFKVYKRKLANTFPKVGGRAPKWQLLAYKVGKNIVLQAQSTAKVVQMTAICVLKANKINAFDAMTWGSVLLSQ